VFDDVEAVGFGPGKVRIRIRVRMRSRWNMWRRSSAIWPRPPPSVSTASFLVVHGGIGMVAVVDRPRVAAKFDTVKDAFTYGELHELLTPYYAGRDPVETFAATEVLGLKRG
jgi:hypothetical protein